MLRLPGLIDPHVHLRTPGQEYKEDFFTGTCAAVAGGYTTIIDMPNNLDPIITKEKLLNKQNIASKNIVCDVGFHFGSLGQNLGEFEKVQDDVLGLKVYLNQTTGNFIVNGDVFRKICESWPHSSAGSEHPILVHAEEDILQEVLDIGHATLQKIHVCHISSRKELEIVLNAKLKGCSVTCGVTPHHLFLNAEEAEKLGPFGMMKPSLKTKVDQDFLWMHLKDIDVIESDHAPHTIEEKQSQNPPFGVPGLETTLPLLLTAANKNQITIDEIKRLCFENPSKLFGIKQEEGTYSEIDENEEWVLDQSKLFTKNKWSPFNGRTLKGKVKTVFERNTKVFEQGKILVEPGFGKIVKPETQTRDNQK